MSLILFVIGSAIFMYKGIKKNCPDGLAYCIGKSMHDFERGIKEGSEREISKERKGL